MQQSMCRLFSNFFASLNHSMTVSKEERSYISLILYTSCNTSRIMFHASMQHTLFGTHAMQVLKEFTSVCINAWRVLIYFRE